MPSGTLSITRRWGGPVYAGPFPVEIDGRVIGSLRALETIELPVEVGRHTVRLGSGRHLSRTYSFEIEEGKTVEFWCRGTMLWPLFVAALLKPELWITFRRV